MLELGCVQKVEALLDSQALNHVEKPIKLYFSKYFGKWNDGHCVEQKSSFKVVDGYLVWVSDGFSADCVVILDRELEESITDKDKFKKLIDDVGNTAFLWPSESCHEGVLE